MKKTSEQSQYQGAPSRWLMSSKSCKVKFISKIGEICPPNDSRCNGRKEELWKWPCPGVLLVHEKLTAKPQKLTKNNFTQIKDFNFRILSQGQTETISKLHRDNVSDLNTNILSFPFYIL